METYFKIEESKKKKSDIVKALQIYISTVDLNSSYTNTNQIREHILTDFQDEDRKLFFYNLYLNNKIYGFAEFGFLPKTETLVIDYICTKERNHCAFYTFYKLALEDITKKLEKKKKHFKYIITEISLENDNGEYIDCDSNYFRKMLSLENYSLLKYPYYQPSLDYSANQTNARGFAIAIKSVSNTVVDNLLHKEQYLSIVEELYYSHYGVWYQKYFDRNIVFLHLEDLLKRVKKSIIEYKSADNITVVNCPIFEEGKCKSVNIQPITLGVKIKKKIAHISFIVLWFLISMICTLIFFQEPTEMASIIGRVTSIISLVSGFITIFLYFRDFFRE